MDLSPAFCFHIILMPLTCERTVGMSRIAMQHHLKRDPCSAKVPALYLPGSSEGESRTDFALHYSSDNLMVVQTLKKTVVFLLKLSLFPTWSLAISEQKKKLHPSKTSDTTHFGECHRECFAHLSQCKNALQTWIIQDNFCSKSLWCCTTRKCTKSHFCLFSVSYEYKI